MIPEKEDIPQVRVMQPGARSHSPAMHLDAGRKEYAMEQSQKLEKHAETLQKFTAILAIPGRVLLATSWPHQ